MPLNLPVVRGNYSFDFPLKDVSFFGVGGFCDIVFYPKDESDLIFFLKNKPTDLKINMLGNMSNVLILDGGIRGCVVNLSKYMNKVKFLEETAAVDAGLSLSKFIKQCVEKSISSCEKLFCIPGTVGGAVAMNAGIPGFEISDVVESIGCVDLNGNKTLLSKDKLNMQYRNGNIPKGFVVTNAALKTSTLPKIELENSIKEIYTKRIKSQPIGQKTCGSTFKNPPGLKAWELIKEAGCDKLTIGNAAVSNIHCNFLVNLGNAKAADFVKLIQTIKDRVFEKTKIMLEEEIVILGED
ncbi:MAG: UDP-N-acetylmuramate dehydrogenase [Holosporales bacterium]|jgi:UDP-N-acetylmuramate dehydrogenase|nr:UDP-N-acetylmuramate dehydrogenase [Holosporales bacterium]